MVLHFYGLGHRVCCRRDSHKGFQIFKWAFVSLDFVFLHEFDRVHIVI